MNRVMSKNKVFHLRLEPSYYNRGFFNITRDFDHLVRSDEGPITLQFRGGGSIESYVDRRANTNSTARG